MSLCRQFSCAQQGCQNTIHLHHETEEKLRRTHETFYCPAGHSNYFAGKTTDQKHLERETRRAARFYQLWEEALDQKEEWKLRAKTCPFGCGFRVVRKSKPENIDYALAQHLVEEHGAVFPAYEPLTEEVTA